MPEISDMLDRIVEMEKEALLPTVCDAVPYWPYQQEAFPYWTNRLGSTSIGDRQAGGFGAEDIEQRSYTVLMRLVIGHITEGYKGERQANLYDWIVQVEDFFMERPLLTSTAFLNPPDYLEYEAELTGHTGLVIFSNAGVFAQQLGVEFSLTVPYVAKAY